MATAKRKVVERYWAIRIGTFKGHVPYFLAGPDGTAKKFPRRRDAQEYKKNEAYVWGAWGVKHWAIVGVDLVER